MYPCLHRLFSRSFSSALLSRVCFIGFYAVTEPSSFESIIYPVWGTATFTASMLMVSRAILSNGTSQVVYATSTMTGTLVNSFLYVPSLASHGVTVG